MEIQKVRFWGTIGVCALVVLGSAGCATKKMVRQNVQSLDTKILGVDQIVDQ